MSPDPTAQAVADPPEQSALKSAHYHCFEGGVAIDVIAKQCDTKDGMSFTKPLAAIRISYKSDDAEKWQDSMWFEKRHVLILRDKCNEIIAEMEAIEADEPVKQ